jgi:hypothetical protein
MRHFYQRLALTCSHSENTSQAEYAGSIPVIGSVITAVQSVVAQKSLGLGLRLVAILSPVQ